MTTESFDNQRWQVIKIDFAGEYPPPYAVVTVIDEIEAPGGDMVIVGRKPVAMDVFRPTVVLGPAPGAGDGYSEYQDTSQHFIARAGEIEPGQRVDVGSDWKMSPNSSGRWRFLGLVPDSATYGVFMPTTTGSAIFLVKMVKVDGDNGDADNMNGYVYNVYHHGPGGVLIEAGITVPYLGSTTRRHDYQTQELGEVDPARSGQAYFADFEGQQRLIIYHATEQFRVGECVPEP